MVRGFQREDAQSAIPKNSPPPESFRLEKLVIFDVFDAEDHDDVITQVRRLFPQASQSWKGQDDEDQMRDRFSDIHSLSFGRIGTIRRNKPFVSSNPYRQIENLDIDVEDVEVSYSKVLPSFVVLCYTVRLSEQFIEHLQQALAKPYLPRITLLKFNLRRGFVGYQKEIGLIARQRVFSLMVNRVQASVEIRLARHFKGLLTMRPNPSSTMLPAIWVIAAKGIPSGHTELTQWARTHSNFLADYSMSLMQGSYLSPNAAVEFGDMRSRTRRSAVILKFEDRPSDHEEQLEKTSHEVLSHLTFDEDVRRIVSYCALNNVLEMCEAKVRELRSNVYVNRRKRSRSWRIGSMVRVGKEIEVISDRVERLGAEMTDLGPLFTLVIQNLQKFRANIVVPFNRLETLDQVATQRLSWYVGSLGKHLARLRSYRQDMLATQNLLVNYRLQVLVFVLSALAVVVAIATGWGGLVDLLHKLIRR